MGLQVDLVEMFGLINKRVCPNCFKQVESRLDDFDIEGNSPRKGEWEFSFYCGECEHEWNEKYKVNFVRIQPK